MISQCSPEGWSIIAATKKARWRARVTKLEAQLVLIDATYDKLATKPYDQYRFDTGEGSQHVRNKSLAEIAKEQTRLQAEIDRLNNLICGSGITRISVNRRGC